MDSKTVVILIMHGMPPSDFPREDLAEWGRLHSGLNHAPPEQRARLEARHHELETRMRRWPRTEANDPFHSASFRMAARLKESTGCDVFVGFGDFCGPTMDEALDSAAASGADHAVVVTPMMTRGGSHTEWDIPAAIKRARAKYPALKIQYAWPFDELQIVHFLTRQLDPYMKIADPSLPSDVTG